MRKIFLSLLAVTGLFCFIVTSCQPELKNVRGLVTTVEIRHDSLLGMKLMVDGDTLLFRMTDARIQNGMMMAGDSVIVDYIEGRHDSLRALVVTLLPKLAPAYTPSTSDTLITIPAQPTEPAEAQEPQKP